MSRNAVVAVLACLLAVLALADRPPDAGAATVAWRDHRLNWDPTSWLAEGDVIARRPVYDFAALPLGNGAVTAMAWNYEPLPNPAVDRDLATMLSTSSDAAAAAFNRGTPALGLALQVTRTDSRDETPATMRSAGRIFLPDLGPLMDPADTVTKLKPHYGWVTTQSRGIYADARVQWDQDAIVLRLRDLPARSRQRIQLDLPMADRAPQTSTSGGDTVALWDTYGSSASRTGTAGAALVARTSNTTAVAAPDARHATITGTADGSGALDVTIAVPGLTSASADPYTAAAPIFTALGSDPVAQASTHQYWWSDFWGRSHMRVREEPDARPAVAATTASSSAGGAAPAAAVDANPRTKWVAGGAGPQWLQLDLARAVEIAGVGVAANPVTAPGQSLPNVYLLDDVQIQVPASGGGWRTVKTVTDNAHWDLRADFAPVTTDSVRVLVDTALNPSTPQVAELELYGTDGALAFRRATAQDSARYAQGLWIFGQYLAAVGQDGARWPLNGLQGPFTNRGDDSDWGSWLWHYNTRWASAPLYSADHAAQAAPYEDYYLRNLAKFKAQARASYGTGGACIGETLDTNGDVVAGCLPAAAPGTPSHPTAMILSTSAEVALNLWHRYETTRDAAFLDLDGSGGAYELMKQVAIFYRDYAQLGRDGAFHIFPAHAQEAYREVCDTIPDLAAIHALFPVVSRLARQRTPADTALADSLDAVVARMPAWPTDPAHGTVLSPSRLADCSAGTARQDNVGQLPELDLVYPFGVAGTGMFPALTDAARTTFRYRKWPIFYDFAPEPVWAARLGLRADVRRTLEWGSSQVQTHPGGFSNTFGSWEASAVYTEWSGIAATALNEMALQSPGEAIDVGSGWPADWGGSFQLLAPGAMVVSAELDHGRPLYVGVRSRRGSNLRLRSPWGASRWRIVHEASGGDVTLWSGTAGAMEVPTTAGETYRAEPVDAPVSGYAYAEVTGTPATSARTWCPVRHGLEAGFTLGLDHTLPPACPQ